MRTKTLVATLSLVLLLLACDNGTSDRSPADQPPTSIATSAAAQEPTPSETPNAWPKGPFAHKCLPENADARGDFDGDGKVDRVRFSPAYANDAGFVGWVLRQRYGDGQGLRQRVDAECPEAIGAADIDQDGNDELFFDTGKGMTAALVDLLVYHRGRLRHVTYAPRNVTLYVGSSNARASEIRCYPTDTEPVLELLEVDRPAGRTTARTFALYGRVLEETGEYPVRGSATGSLRCFGLRWKGY